MTVNVVIGINNLTTEKARTEEEVAENLEAASWTDIE